MEWPKELAKQAAESILIKEGNKAIDNFVAMHSEEICSSFAFNIDCCFGDVVICFDTLDNSLLHAKRHELHVRKVRKSVFQKPDGWLTAREVLLHSKICNYNPHTDYFKYNSFASFRLPKWEDFFGAKGLPEYPDPPDPAGYVIVILDKVIDQLVASNSFDKIPMSSPFTISIELGFGLVVMRILNWPSHSGPRV